MKTTLETSEDQIVEDDFMKSGGDPIAKSKRFISGMVNLADEGLISLLLSVLSRDLSVVSLVSSALSLVLSVVSLV